MLNEVPPESPEAQNIERMVSIWTHFAKTGDPNCEVIGQHKWKPVVSADDVLFEGLNIDDDLSIIEFPEEVRMSFWNGILKL